MVDVQIKRFQIIPEKIGFSMLRATELKSFGNKKIYETTKIQSIQITYADIVPGQRYVLSENLKTIVSIHSQFQKKNIDIFNLRGYLRFWTKDTRDKPFVFMPPIVEMVRHNGKTVPLLVDGMHRTLVSKILCQPIRVIVISGVPKEYPPYFHPLDMEWNAIKVMDQIPYDFQRKEYRTKDGLGRQLACYTDLRREFKGDWARMQLQMKRVSSLRGYEKEKREMAGYANE